MWIHGHGGFRYLCSFAAGYVPGIFHIFWDNASGVDFQNFRGLEKMSDYRVLNDLSLALVKGIDALKLAFAIVMGIVFIVTIPRQFFSVGYWRKQLPHYRN